MAQDKKGALDFSYLSDLKTDGNGQQVTPDPNFSNLLDPRMVASQRNADEMAAKRQLLQQMFMDAFPQQEQARQDYAQQQEAETEVPTAFTQQVSSVGNPLKRGVLQNMIGSTASGMRLLPRAAFQVLGAGQRGFGQPKQEIDDPGKIIAENAAKWVQSKMKPEDFATGEYARGPQNIKEAFDLNRIGMVIAEQGPQMIGFMAATAANPAFGFVVMGAVEGGEAAERMAEYEQRTGKQLDPTFKAMVPVLVGSVNAALERVGIEAALGKIPGVRSRLLKLLLGGIGEGGTEAVQQVSHLLAQAGYDKPDRKQVAKEMFDSFYAGSILGLGASTVTQSAGFVRSKAFHKRLSKGRAIPKNPEEWLAFMAFERGYDTANEVDRAFIAAEEIKGESPEEQFAYAKDILNREFPAKPESAAAKHQKAKEEFKEQKRKEGVDQYFDEQLGEGLAQSVDRTPLEKEKPTDKKVNDYFKSVIEEGFDFPEPAQKTNETQQDKGKGRPAETEANQSKEAQQQTQTKSEQLKNRKTNRITNMAQRMVDGEKMSTQDDVKYLLQNEQAIRAEMERIRSGGKEKQEAPTPALQPEQGADLPESAQEAIKAATGGTLDINFLAGKSNIRKRQALLEKLTGKPVPKRQAGLTNLQQVIDTMKGAGRSEVGAGTQQAVGAGMPAPSITPTDSDSIVADDPPAEPTPAQAEAGNAKKGHVSIAGLNISIETAKGQTRRGKGPDGKKWSQRMKLDYGYIRDTVGPDKDHIDIFVNTQNAESKTRPIFVVDQVDQKSGEFDEPKVMLGFKSKKDARRAYLSNYEKGWKAGKITQFTRPEFDAWAFDEEYSKKPAADFDKSILRTKSSPGNTLREQDEGVTEPTRKRSAIEMVANYDVIDDTIESKVKEHAKFLQTGLTESGKRFKDLQQVIDGDGKADVRAEILENLSQGFLYNESGKGSPLQLSRPTKKGAKQGAGLDSVNRKVEPDAEVVERLAAYDRGETPAQPQPKAKRKGFTEKDFRSAILKNDQFDFEETGAIFSISDAVARTWAKKNGKSVDDFYSYIAGIESGGHYSPFIDVDLMQYIGRHANLPKAIQANLAAAIQMDAAGKDSETIRTATGWFKGRYDGKWRYEISNLVNLEGKLKPITVVHSGEKVMGLTLIDAVEAGAISRSLIDAYPELLENYDTRIYVDETFDDTITGGYFSGEGSITIFAENVRDAEEFLSHELQHAIQEIEGFARGSTIEEAGSFENYLKVAGEIEARDVERRPRSKAGKRLIPPFSRENIAPEQAFLLFQTDGAGQVKGAVKFGVDGKALIYQFESGDISTIMHELFHVWRRVAIPKDDLKILANAFGAKNYLAWSVDAEEKAAKAFEEYLRSGKAPTSELRAVFERLKQWLNAIYAAIRGEDVNISPEVRAVFDRMLGGPESIGGGQLQQAEQPAIAGPEIAPEQQRTPEMQSKLNEVVEYFMGENGWNREKAERYLKGQEKQELTDKEIEKWLKIVREFKESQEQQPTAPAPQPQPVRAAQTEPTKIDSEPPKVEAVKPPMEGPKIKIDQTEAGEQFSFSGQATVPPGKIKPKKPQRPVEGYGGIGMFGEEVPEAKQEDMFAEPAAAPTSVIDDTIAPEKPDMIKNEISELNDLVGNTDGKGRKFLGALKRNETGTAGQNWTAKYLYDKDGKIYARNGTKKELIQYVKDTFLHSENESRPKDRPIGKNSDGDFLREDQDGIRVILTKSGIRIGEKVEVVPTRSGYQTVLAGEREDRFKTVEELAAEKKSPSPPTTTTTQGAATPSAPADAPSEGGPLSPPSSFDFDKATEEELEAYLNAQIAEEIDAPPVETIVDEVEPEPTGPQALTYTAPNGLSYSIGAGARTKELTLTQTLVMKDWTYRDDDMKPVVQQLVQDVFGQKGSAIPHERLQEVIDHAKTKYGIEIVAKPHEAAKPKSEAVKEKAAAKTGLTARQQEAVKLLYRLTHGTGGLHMLAGNKNKEARQTLLATLIGKKVTKAEAGIMRLEEEFYKIAKPQGGSAAAEYDDFRNWVKRIAGNNAEETAIPEAAQAEQAEEAPKKKGISREELQLQLEGLESDGVIPEGTAEPLFLLFDTAAKNIASWYTNTAPEDVYRLFGGVEYTDKIDVDPAELADKFRFPDGVPKGYSLTGRITVQNGVYLVQTAVKNSPDVLVHEFGHFFRQMLPKAEAKRLRDWAEGGKEYDPNSKWSRSAEERYARAFEKFFETGELPDDNLKPIFQKIKDAIIAIFKVYDKPGINDVYLSKEIRDHFRKLLQAPGQGFARGDRVEITRKTSEGNGRAGSIVRISEMRTQKSHYEPGVGMVDDGTDTTYYYYVKSDNGAVFGPLNEKEISKTTVAKPENVVSDPVYDGQTFTPQTLAKKIESVSSIAERYRASARRRRKADYKKKDLQKAKEHEGVVIEMQGVLDRWKKQYPDEANRLDVLFKFNTEERPAPKLDEKPDDIKNAFDDLKGHLGLAEIEAADPFRNKKAIALVSKVLSALAKSGVRDYESAVRKFSDELGADVTVKLEHAISTGWGILRRLNRDFDAPTPISEILAGDEKLIDMQTGQKSGRPDDPEMTNPEIQNTKPGTRSLVNEVTVRVYGKVKFTNPMLTTIADDRFGGTILDGTYTSADKYDAFETGFNKWVLETKPRSLEQIREAVDNFPRQNQRTAEKDNFQQFSTIPTEAFVANYALNVRKGETVLEPSAGNGGLAVFSANDGAKVVTNEISKRRSGLLQYLGFESYSVDAQYLDDLLPPEIKPTAILMNPPFSATGGRLSRNKTEYGAQHVEQALRRLENGGRLVAIVGEGMAIGKPTFTKWWDDISAKYNVRANIGIPGDEYAKYGTTFDNQILVIDKTGATPGNNFADRLKQIERRNVKDLEEALNVLERIRNDRPKSVENTLDELPIGSGQSGRPAGGRSGSTQPARPRQPGVGSDRDAAGTSNENVQGSQQPEAGQTATGAGSTVSTRGGSAENVSELESAELTEEDQTRENDKTGKFVEYKPAKFKIKGAKKHPANIVESASMAAVDPPDIDYKPNLPQELIDSGMPSDLQLEAIAYAGKRFEQRLPDGRRAGFFIGDGTGVGKGLQMAGIARDQWNRGTKRILWISVSNDLLKDAKRDLGDIKFPGEIHDLGKQNANKQLDFGDGLVFTTYNTFISQGKGQRAQTRIDQLKKWLGNDCLICFDEAHKAKNAIINGAGKPSQTATKIIEIQDSLPDAKVVYMSATGATEVRNMAYMTRLGLWGEGTPFPGGFMGFLNEVEDGGIGAMEMAARDLKALGMYVSRSISFDGVEYREEIHNLTPEQTQTYDIAAEAWRSVSDGFVEALNTTNANSTARRFALQAFWSSHQRFFKGMTTAMKIPTAIKVTEKALDEGKSVVLSIIGTNESRTADKVGRAVAEGKDLDSLDFTPRELLGHLIETAFPTQQYTEEENPDTGTIVRVPLLDDQGNPVQSREALEAKQRLLDSLSDMDLPDNPLDQIINYFGADKVAELTGRKRRLIKHKLTGKTTYQKRKPEGVRAKDVNTWEMNNFQSGKKRIAIISTAASTGISLHADKRAKNQQRRVQVTLELGWSADVQMQTFGRTHRSNQLHPPEYVLLTSNVGGEKRFSATIARRLSSLGALTKGQRDTSGGDDLAKYNFETIQGKGALLQLYFEIMRSEEGDGTIPGIENPKQALRDMGILEQGGGEEGREGIKQSRENVTTFLNRVLALDVERQNYMFDAFYTRFVAAVQHAKDMGTFDDGVADIKGTAIRLLPQQDIINTDATTGAETKHYTVEVDKPTKPITYGEVGIFGGNFWQNNTTKRYYHAKPSGSAITDVKTGRAENKYMVSSPTGNTRYMGETELTAKFRPITAGSSEVKQWWDNEVANLPPVKTSKVHIFGGAILPIWNQLKAGGVSRLRIVRVQTDAGERVVGVQIPAQKVNLLLRRFGLGENPTTAKDIINEVRENKGSVTLQVPQISAGRPVRVVPGRLGGVDTVELEKIPSNLTAQALQFGLIAERIDYKQRWFLPSQREVEVLEDVLKAWPAKVEETNEEGPQADADAEFADFVKDLPAKTQGATFKYSDPRLESDHKQSHGLSKSTFFESAKEAAAHIRQRLTRGAHEHLPRTAQFAPLRHELLRLQKQRSIVADRAINNMRRIVEGMTGDEYNVFERLVLVRDLAQEEKAGRQLPGYWTPELVNTELMRLNAHAQEMPIVQDALNIRNDSWDDLKRRYEKAMKQIGENVTQKFQREDYYRHQVLNYAQTMAPESSRSKLRNPITAGYLKQRKGKSIENKETGKAQSINTFYLQAEFEVMSNMLYDIERANVLAMVESIYSITKDLKAQARSLNDAKIKSYFVSVAKATGAENPQEEGARMYRIAMNQAQAIGFSKLQELADKELLPEGSAGQWTDVIESIQAGDMNDDIFRYLSWGLRVKDPALSPVASQIFAGIREKRKFTKETLQQIGQYTDWRDLINKDTHRAWQPREGNVMFMAYSVPERLANQLVESELEKIGLTKDDLAKMFAIGGKHREYVIPHEVANQLDDLAPNIAKSTLGRYAKEAQTKWKWWTLLAPRRALKYNFRNVTGDADAVFVGNPDTFKYMHKAMSELYQYFTTGVIPDGNKTLSDWVGYGGMQSLLQTQELTELDKLKQFKGIIDKNPTAMERLKSVPLAYAKFVRLGTDYREALLRYASYLSYLNQIEKNGGKPDNFGASIRQEVMALRSNEDKAYWLSNDLLGAYDDVSVIGQELRSRWYPFWSWKEVNTKRYIRFWKNAMQDGRLMMTVGRKVAGLTVRSPLLLIKLGKLTVASHVLWGMLQAWNYLVFGDEEEELPESIKSRPHIILYKKDNGEIVYFHQLGAVGDFMQWVGAEDWPYMVKDLLNGRTTLPEIVKKVAKSPVNIIWQGLRPEAKIAVEQIGGKSTYPDVFKPRTVRDKAEAMFRVLQLEEEYKLVRGMPSRGYGKGWEKAAWYTIDADRAAYITIYDEKERFKRLRGEEYTGGGFVSAKSNALYNFKLALRYKDKVAAEKFLLEYASLGGTKAGIKASMKSLHPLNGLSEEKQKAFVRYLDDDGRKKLIQALRHYESVVKLTDQGEQFMGVLLSDTLSEKGKKRLAKIGIDKIFLKDD